MAQGFIKAVDEGLLGQVLGSIIEKGFGLPWLVNKAAEVTEGIVAGASGIIDKVATLPITNPISTTLAHTPIEPPKLGRGGRDAAIVAAMGDQSQVANFASLGDLGGLSGQFSNVGQQRDGAGFSMNA